MVTCPVSFFAVGSPAVHKLKQCTARNCAGLRSDPSSHKAFGSEAKEVAPRPRHSRQHWTAAYFAFVLPWPPGPMGVTQMVSGGCPGPSLFWERKPEFRDPKSVDMGNTLPFVLQGGPIFQGCSLCKRKHP